MAYFSHHITHCAQIVHSYPLATATLCVRDGGQGHATGWDRLEHEVAKNFNTNRLGEVNKKKPPVMK